MEDGVASLALVAALVIISVWGVAAASLVLSLLGFRVVGGFFGAISILAGAWLLFVLPHVPLLGIVSLGAGWFAVARCFGEKGGGGDEK